MTSKRTKVSCPPITCIIPAYNEQKTIADVIKKIKRVPEIKEILLVDDGSTDSTVSTARKYGVRVVKHHKNLGKGAAMKTGAHEAKHNLIIFIDADIENMTTSKIKNLITPLLNNEADFVKGSYDYSMGRVSKLVAQPLLRIVYPFLKLKHPLSGEVALKRNKFHFDKIENGWGVDIQLVLQAAERKLRIKEVDLGKKEHKHQGLDSLSEMSEQIIRTILSELHLIANKYNLVFFDLDKTLIVSSSIESIAREWGFAKEIASLFKCCKEGKIADKEITKQIARHFKGKTQEDVDRICETIPLHPFAEQIISQLRKQRFRVRIISSAYSPVVKHFAHRLNVHDFVCPRLNMDSRQRYTGALRKSRFEDFDNSCCGLYVCKKKAVNFICRKFKCKSDECIAVGDGKSDSCMFKSCGLSLGYQTDIALKRIESLSEILMYTV